MSIADVSLATGVAVVLTTLLGEEERKTYPNVTNWYLALVSADSTIGPKDLPKDAHKAFKPKEKKQSKQDKKEEKKEEKKPDPAAEDDDLFGDSPATTT